MSEIIVRRAENEDFERIYALEKVCFSDPWSPGMFESFKNSPVGECAAAFCADELCGYACVYIVDGEPESFDGDCELADIAVSPMHRHKNIARTLLGYVYSRAAQRYCSHIFLEVRESNTAARRLYESEGFTVTGKRKNYYVSPLEDAVLMKKELAENLSAPGKNNVDIGI